MNEIACTDLIKSDQVKGTIKVLFWRYKDSVIRRFNYTEPRKDVPIYETKRLGDISERNIIGYNHVSFLNKEASFYFTMQALRFKDSETSLEEVYQELRMLVQKKVVPFRYMPKFKRISIPVNQRRKPDFEYDFYVMDFDAVLISLLTQKLELGDKHLDIEVTQKVIKFLELMNEHSDGITLDEYLDRWVDRLLK